MSACAYSGCLNKAPRAHKSEKAFHVSAGVPAQLLQRTQGDACEHSSDESDAPQPRDPLREQPHLAECHQRHQPQPTAAHAQRSNGCIIEAAGSEAANADLAQPQEQDSAGQQSTSVGPPVPELPCMHSNAPAPACMPDAGKRNNHTEGGRDGSNTQPSNPLFEKRFLEQHDREAAVPCGEKTDRMKQEAKLDGPVSKSTDMRASESDIEGPATPACDVHKASVAAAPKQPLSSPDAAMLQRQVDLLKEQVRQVITIFYYYYCYTLCLLFLPNDTRCVCRQDAGKGCQNIIFTQGIC